MVTVRRLKGEEAEKARLEREEKVEKRRLRKEKASHG